MSLRGATWGKSNWGRRGNLVAVQGEYALATRLPRFARNDIQYKINGQFACNKKRP